MQVPLLKSFAFLKEAPHSLISKPFNAMGLMTKAELEKILCSAASVTKGVIIALLQYLIL